MEEPLLSDFSELHARSGPPPAQPLTLSALWALLALQLRPFGTAAAAAAAGPASRAAFSTPAASRALLAEQLPQLQASVDSTQLLLTRLRQLAAAAHADHQEVLRTGVLPAQPAPLPGIVHTVLFAAQLSAGAPQPLEPPESGSPEAVWAAECAVATAGNLEVAVGTHVALQALHASPPETYAAGASMVAEELVAGAERWLAAQQARMAWVTPLLEAGE